MIHTEHWVRARRDEARRRALADSFIFIAVIAALILTTMALFVTVD